MRTGKIKRVDLWMLFLQRPAPFERALDRNLAQLLEIRATGKGAGRLQSEKVFQIFLVPGILLGCERMHRADLARAERLVGSLLGARAARHRDADVILQFLEEVVERKSARQIDR